MKIKNIEIKNYTSIKRATIDVESMLGLIGQNNVGKSNILKALDLFFNSNSKISEESFYDRNTSNPIEIAIHFYKFTLDEGKHFSSYIINDKFRITKKISMSSSKSISTDTFYGENEKENKQYDTYLKTGLPKCVFIPAVRDVNDETKVMKTNPFGILINQILAKISDKDEKNIKDRLSAIKELLNSQDKKQRINSILELEKDLNDNLEGFMPDFKLEFEIPTPTFDDLFKNVNIIADDGFKGNITNKGHGLQRYVIFIILKIYSEIKIKSKIEKPITIFLIEEPEIYLHPQAQKKFYHIFKEISSESDQVIYATHSSLFVDMEHFDQIAIVSKNIEDMKNVDNKKNIEDMKNVDNKKNIEDMKNVDNKKNIEDMKNVDNKKNIEDMKNVDNKKNIEDMKNVDNKKNIEDMKNVDNKKNTKIMQLSMKKAIDNFKVIYPSKNFTDSSIRDRLSHAYDHSMNEAFFAKKIILVEGCSEVYALSIYCMACGYNLEQENILLIDVNGKGNIVKHLNIFNGFGIPCYVIFDGDKGGTVKKLKESKEILKLLKYKKTILPTEIVHDTFAMFEHDFEKQMKIEIKNYDDLEKDAKIELGLINGSKPLIAKYIARKITTNSDGSYNENGIPCTIKKIIIAIKNLT